MSIPIVYYILWLSIIQNIGMEELKLYKYLISKGSQFDKFNKKMYTSILVILNIKLLIINLFIKYPIFYV